MDDPKKRAQISWGRDWSVQKAALECTGITVSVCAYTMLADMRAIAGCGAAPQLVTNTCDWPRMAE